MQHEDDKRKSSITMDLKWHMDLCFFLQGCTPDENREAGSLHNYKDEINEEVACYHELRTSMIQHSILT